MLCIKAANYYGVYDLRVEESPAPEIGGDELLIKVRACSICGTDLRIYRYGHFKIPAGTPRVLGHEVSGQVALAGSPLRSL